MANRIKLNTMFYILHHPKGTLMLSAQDRDQVAKWSERQLGKNARLATISEKEFSEKDGYVEKDGTGIRVITPKGCKPVMSIMANYLQNLRSVDEDQTKNDVYVNGLRFAGRMLTLH